MLLARPVIICQRPGPALEFARHVDQPARGLAVSGFGGHLAAIGSVIKQSPDFYLHHRTTAPIDESCAASNKSGKIGNKLLSRSLDHLVVPDRSAAAWSPVCTCAQHNRHGRSTSPATMMFRLQIVAGARWSGLCGSAGRRERPASMNLPARASPFCRGSARPIIGEDNAAHFHGLVVGKDSGA